MKIPVMLFALSVVPTVSFAREYREPREIREVATVPPSSCQADCCEKCECQDCKCSHTE
jgi:hypothetical protein